MIGHRALKSCYFSLRCVYQSHIKMKCCRLANVDVQHTMAAVMSSHANVSADNLGVSAKLANTDRSGPSYSSVVDVLKTTPDMVSPLMKLNNLCKFMMHSSALPKYVFFLLPQVGARKPCSFYLNIALIYFRINFSQPK